MFQATGLAFDHGGAENAAPDNRTWQRRTKSHGWKMQEMTMIGGEKCKTWQWRTKSAVPDIDGLIIISHFFSLFCFIARKTHISVFYINFTSLLGYTSSSAVAEAAPCFVSVSS